MRRWMIGVTGVVIVGAAVAALLAFRGGPDAYAALRQTRVQELPGALGFELRPPPDGFVPAIEPEAARTQGTYGDRARRTAVLSLATVHDRFEGTDATAWVVLTRGICISDFKGELVQASRHPNRQGICDDRNLWFEMIDATTGDSVMRTRGYDPDVTFVLARAGSQG